MTLIGNLRWEPSQKVQRLFLTGCNEIAYSGSGINRVSDIVKLPSFPVFSNDIGK